MTIFQSNVKPPFPPPELGALMSTCAVLRGAGADAGVVGADPSGVLVAGAAVAGDDGAVRRATPRVPPGRSELGVGSKRVHPTPASQTSPQACASSDVTR